jgi:hypothetical protein
MSDIMPEFEVEKAKSRKRVSPSEEAAIITKAALGESDTEIAKSLDRSAGFVAGRRKDPKIDRRIEELRLKLREEHIEDFNQVVILGTMELIRRASDPVEASKMKDKDLTGMVRHFYNMMQLQKGAPTSISEVHESGMAGRAFVEGVLLGRTYNENFEARQREQIAAVIPITGEILEGEVVEDGTCHPD